ncbi:DNA mismatch repair protein MutS [Verrucomicrobia bacterium]|nr:DNA mismatch repair protein MutS [Verrucomicrobiota bacterium]MDG1891553.1 DNA mismatch repair protein MutS [Verrucomicrobiota bacterium]
MAKSKASTPMMEQYRGIKAEMPPETLLLFRLGDFYEMFFEDAQTGAGILNVALTKRGSTPMCGIPYHAASNYISKILEAGRKVAICDQVEVAKPGKLVRRAVTQILSPGTHFDDKLLLAESHNYLAGLYQEANSYGIAYIDLTTGTFVTMELSSELGVETELQRIQASEVVIPAENDHLKNLVSNQKVVISEYDDWVFQTDTALFTLLDHFKVKSLDGFGLKDKISAIGAAGGILHYLIHQLRRDVQHLTQLSCYEPAAFLILDAVTLRHLEIVDPGNKDASSTSVFKALNETVTPMGARKLKEWLTRPLADLKGIQQRQEAVNAWIQNPISLSNLRDSLKYIRDLERTLSRLSSGSGNARDLNTLKAGLENIPKLLELLTLIRSSPEIFEPRLAIHAEDSTDDTPSLLERLEAGLHPLPDIVNLIGKSIVDEPSAILKEGNLIREGFSPELDEIHKAKKEGKTWIAKFQAEQIESTQIPSLKVRFNSVFGYFIEITRTHLDKVPVHYHRKQTIANGERFITESLKEVEGKILGAEERAVALEYELYQGIREKVLMELKRIQETSTTIADIDVLSSFAELARMHDYCCPTMTQGGECSITQGRHPVLEQTVQGERFVPNDCALDQGKEQIALITGPNMAGKSTYIRQTALLAILAHAGSFIPADAATIGVMDRIFTRIGASDDLSRGQSTFMVEMTETANILNNATYKSLVILDEIGRGTSTFDGLSLAWSIVEYLHNQVGAKTLFATHYHELTELSRKLDRVRNYNVAVKEWNDKVVFLHQILPGGTDKSYGIQVARLAGVPLEVIQRAKQILENLEETELTPVGQAKLKTQQRAERQKLKNLEPSSQLDLFAESS